ncbi:ATP synthase F1 subunit gamma [Spiroplasma melliferum]|uniref:ATP synthase gamma chain n=2 Tax=Spiroplasma melliferum TaxID=2134 RepID=A0AAI9T2R7_SPIME|nr:ATP synthase F1 subunit gamma [Spiroplasma melliferum]ELL44509.1 F0F1 ATP synthase subunit gamma [Spiroplasma melliferum IPMB4A]KAI92436.1 ATP synthase F0F1 subunit gamma [Spiroplasma melliferum KC3]QCO23359.1 F0F1 ATP synthase subunit gamma [Spiroplasma melliferum]
MAVGTGLKKQITSITSTSKITQAMKLVATAKLKKVGKRISNSKPYFAEVYTVFNDIISKADDSIYQKKDGTKVSERTCWIIVNSNLGLCGGYNININKLVLQQLRKNDCIIAIGSKAETFYAHKGYEIMQTRKDIDINFSYDDAREFAQEILSGFNGNTYDEIKIAYTKFINNVTFDPTILQLLPIIKATQHEEPKHINVITEFEPDPTTILENAVPMYLNTILFSSIVESQVSEQASRRVAMENATDNANAMLEKLSLLYNRKRQAAITQEITEIVAGAGAQEN